MAGSTMRARVGRVAGCGRTTAPTSSGISKAARAPRGKWCTFNCDRIRWRDSGGAKIRPSVLLNLCIFPRLSTSARHRGFNRARKTLLEVQNGDPFWLDGDTSHLRKHAADPLHPRPPLLWTEVSLRRQCIFGSDARHGLDAGRASNLQHFVGPRVAVDAQCDLRIARECLYLG